MQVGLENGQYEISNLRSEGEVILLIVQSCDNSKVFSSENQHLRQ